MIELDEFSKPLRGKTVATKASDIKGTISVERAMNMEKICHQAVEVLKIKNPKYGDSWKSHGGFSAFFNMQRKWSRVEHLASQHGYDIFRAIQATAGQPDGMEEALRDLMGYDILILDDQFLAVGDKELRLKRDKEL